MKRSELQRLIANIIEIGIKEGVSATDTTDYETWLVAHSLAHDILNMIEEADLNKWEKE